MFLETLLSHDVDFGIETLAAVVFLTAHEHSLELVRSQLHVEMLLLGQVFIDDALKYGASRHLAMNVDQLIRPYFIENLGRKVQSTASSKLTASQFILKSVQTGQLILKFLRHVGRLGIDIVRINLLVDLLDSLFRNAHSVVLDRYEQHVSVHLVVTDLDGAFFGVLDRIQENVEQQLFHLLPGLLQGVSLDVLDVLVFERHLDVFADHFDLQHALQLLGEELQVDVVIGSLFLGVFQNVL